MLRFRLLSLGLRVLQKIQIWTYNYLLNSTVVLKDKAQMARIVASTKYNMNEEPNELYYLEQYFHQIEKFLPLINTSQGINILDLGCGQGRFIQRYLQIYPQANITGIDISEEAIEYNKKQFIKNNKVGFKVGNYSEILDSFPDKSFEIVNFTEVSFFYPEWKNDFPRILSKLKTNGQIIFSTRSTYFNVMSQIAVGNFRDALRISESSEGNISITDPLRFSWNKSQELIEFFEDHKTKILSISGVGVCSGIEGDPLSKIATPNSLTINDREILCKIENSFSTLIPDNGRYILVIANKLGINDS